MTHEKKSLDTTDLKTQQYAKKIRQISKTLGRLVWDIINELRESEQRNRSIVEFAADAIITMSPEGKVVSWNRGAEMVFGYSEQEALGKDLDDLIFRDRAEREAQSLSSRVLKGESIRSLEAIRYNKAGEAKHVLISAAPIKNAAGQIDAVSLMYKDITELKLAHEQLLRTEKQATLGVIAGSIGHELNNLVSGLIIQAEMLQKHYNQPEKVKEIATIFADNLNKVAIHGKNLLSLSKPSKPHFEPLDVNIIVQETTDTLLLTGVLKHFTIERQLCSKCGYVNGDRNLLEQVIRNIEINAAHAMQPGGKLTIVTLNNGNFYEMHFTDTGTGIPPQLLNKIFQPFFTTKPEGQGTGLGLPIVKQIVEQHQGEIHIQSQVGKGTTVIVRLPLMEIKGNA